MENLDFEHINEANRLTRLANSDPDNMGRIERAMHLAEANNHLLWALLGGTGIHICTQNLGGLGAEKHDTGPR